MLVALVAGTTAAAWVIAARESLFATDVYLPPPSVTVGHGPGADVPSPQSLLEDVAVVGDVIARSGIRMPPTEVSDRLSVRWDPVTRIASVRLRGLGDADGRRAAGALADRLAQRWTAALAAAREYQARVKFARDRVDALVRRFADGADDTPRLDALVRLESELVALNDRLATFGFRTNQGPRVVRPPHTPSRGLGTALVAGLVAALLAALVTLAVLALRLRGSRQPRAVG